MLEKWKQRAIKMNLKKAVIFFLITSFAAAIGFSAVLYSNFHGRIFEWEQFAEEYKRLNMSAGDLALIAGCGIIGIIIGIWYWLLVLACVYRKSYRMGVNTAFWTFAALIFNLAALAVLYLYAMLKGTCTNCGRVRSGSGKFCDRCGNLLKKECPQCRQALDISSAYCSNCGKKLDEKES